MMAKRNKFRSSDRWLVAEYVFSLFGPYSSGHFQSSMCAFSNAFHVNDPPVFYIRSRALISTTTIDQLKSLLSSLHTIEYVSFAFCDELLQPNGGCRITANAIVSWQGNPFFVTASAAALEPTVAATVELSEQIGLIRNAMKAVDLVSADFWQEIVDRIRTLRANYSEQAFPILPHVTDMQVVVIAVDNTGQTSPDLLAQLAKLLWGLNPWEILLTTNEQEPKLIEAIYAEQALPDFCVRLMHESNEPPTN